MQLHGQVQMRIMLNLLLCFLSFAACAQTPGEVPVNIFGDGNPDNGIEDSRQQLLGGSGMGLSLADQRMNAGTVQCDGKNRGTAMVVETSEFSDGIEGVVLASAAHVFFDLKEKHLFKRCEFHFLALGELPGYRARIDLSTTLMGDYDPSMATEGLDFGEGDWAFLYIPKPWQSYHPGGAIRLRDFFSLQLESFQQFGGEFRLVAFDTSEGAMSISRNCTVAESVHDDLGGGGWRGQLLDDCDSADGASGGGIIAVVNGQQYLVGIRSGSHWSEELYPGHLYPQGPPDGSVWSPQFNTNFSRGIDMDIIYKFKKFMKHIENNENIF